MKDLGGGGLSCAISETAESLDVGIELDVQKVHLREEDLSPDEIMVSESQERMLIITNPKKLSKNLENRFEFTLFRKFPELHQLKTLCLKHGALGASVSGSGSALFALFETESEQMNAAKKLKRTSNVEIYPCKMLKTHTYDPL